MTTTVARTDDALTHLTIVGVRINFSPLQLQSLRRINRTGEPEVFSIKAENLGVGDTINILSEEEGKVQNALEKGTGVRVTIDPYIQTKPILDWIKSTLHTGKPASRASKKTKDVVEVLTDVIEPEEQSGNGGDLPYHPRGRGFMTRRLRVAPSLAQWRAAHPQTVTQVNGKGVGKVVRKATRATHRGVVRASNKLQNIISRLRKIRSPRDRLVNK